MLMFPLCVCHQRRLERPERPAVDGGCGEGPEERDQAARHPTPGPPRTAKSTTADLIVEGLPLEVNGGLLGAKKMVPVHGSGMTLVQAPTASRASASGLFWPPHRHRAMPPVKRQLPRLKEGIPSLFARYSVANISAKMTLSAAARRSLSPYQSPIRTSTRAVISRHRQFQEAPSGRRR
jgi:hypothetical protein